MWSDGYFTPLLQSSAVFYFNVSNNGLRAFSGVTVGVVGGSGFTDRAVHPGTGSEELG